MMKGQINATVVDLSNKNKLMEMGGDKFHVLPGVTEVPSDELIFASDDWIANHPEAVSVVVEELLKLWNEMEANPAIIEEERAKRNLLADQPKELLEEVVPFYTEGSKEGIFSTTGGGIEAAKADFDFYTEACQMEGPASSLKVENRAEGRRGGKGCGRTCRSR